MRTRRLFYGVSLLALVSSVPANNHARTEEGTMNKRVATPSTLLPIIVKLFEIGGQGTASEVGTDAIRMGRLIQRKLVVKHGEVYTGGRGRPAFVYKLTKAGRERARRAAKREEHRSAS